MKTTIITVVSRKLRQHRYQKDCEGRYRAFQPCKEEEAVAPKEPSCESIFLEETFEGGKTSCPQVSSNKTMPAGEQAGKETAPPQEEPLAPTEKKKKSRFAKEKKPKKEKKKRTKISAAIKETEGAKSAIKRQFQKSKKVRKFSIFEPVEQEETPEEMIKRNLNEDGYYDVIAPADAGKTTRRKKQHDKRKLALLAGLVLIATALLAFIIREFNQLL